MAGIVVQARDAKRAGIWWWTCLRDVKSITSTGPGAKLDTLVDGGGEVNISGLGNYGDDRAIHQISGYRRLSRFEGVRIMRRSV